MEDVATDIRMDPAAAESGGKLKSRDGEKHTHDIDKEVSKPLIRLEEEQEEIIIILMAKCQIIINESFYD